MPKFQVEVKVETSIDIAAIIRWFAVAIWLLT